MTPPPSPVPTVSIARSSIPRPAPLRHSPIVAAFASLSIPLGSFLPLGHAITEVESRKREVHPLDRAAGPLVDGDGIPNPTAAIRSSSSSATAASSPSRRLVRSCGVGLSWRRSLALRSHELGQDLGPAEVHPDHVPAPYGEGYRNPPDGRLRGEAVSRLSRGPHEGQGPGVLARPRPLEAGPLDIPRRWRRGPRRRRQAGRAPAAQGLDVEALDVGDARRPRWVPRRVGHRRLLLGAKRRRGREREANRSAPTRRSRGRSMLLDRDDVLLLGTDHSTNGQAGRSADQHPDWMDC